MKYRPQDVAFALAEVISSAKEKDHAAIAKNFLSVIKAAGLERQGRDILLKAERLIAKKTGGRSIVIETARPLDPELEKMLAALAKPGDVVRRRTEPDIVAGFKITINDESEFDGSLKRKLSKLFA